MKGFTTKAIHGSIRKQDVHGTLRPAVYDNVAFEFPSACAMQQAFEGRRPAHSYSRISNSTVEEFEDRVRLLADAKGALAVASGMAATRLKTRGNRPSHPQPLCLPRPRRRRTAA